MKKTDSIQAEIGAFLTKMIPVPWEKYAFMPNAKMDAHRFGLLLKKKRPMSFAHKNSSEQDTISIQ